MSTVYHILNAEFFLNFKYRRVQKSSYRKLTEENDKELFSLQKCKI